VGGPAAPGLLVGPDTAELLAIAVEAARSAGGVLRERFGGPRAGVEAKTTPTDLVSEADHIAEQAIRALLARRRPDDAILGEELGPEPGVTGLRWVVDPLDGTVNFLFGIPQWAVSVACEDGDGTLAGVVYDPLREETFAAVRDGAATLNGDPISGSTCAELASAMVATGFAYDAAVRAEQARVMTQVVSRARDVRRFGSAALDLAWSACGRYDAFYERALNPWDLAAGALICARAGLSVRRLAPDGLLPAGLLVAPPALLSQLEPLVAGRA
jgi:myo-inositol-1(or 4)-monophosphatase